MTLDASPRKGWIFSHWEGDLTGTDKRQTILMNNDKNITAVFVKLRYNLTIHIVGDGRVDERILSAPKATSIYDDDTMVSLEAIPGVGSKFVEWRGDLTGSENPSSITMDSSKLVTAVFEPLRYEINTTVVGNGVITKDPNQEDYVYGSSVTLTAVPEEGSQFSHWEGALSGNTNPATLTVDEAKNVTAHFFSLEDRDYFGLEVGNTWTMDNTYSRWIDGSLIIEERRQQTIEVLSQTDEGNRIVFKMGLNDDSQGQYWSKEGNSYYDIGRWEVGESDWWFPEGSLLVTNPIQLGDEGMGGFVAIRQEMVSLPAGTFDTWVFHGEVEHESGWKGEYYAWIAPYVGIVKAEAEGEYQSDEGEQPHIERYYTNTELTSFTRGGQH